MSGKSRHEHDECSKPNDIDEAIWFAIRELYGIRVQLTKIAESKPKPAKAMFAFGFGLPQQKQPK